MAARWELRRRTSLSSSVSRRSWVRWLFSRVCVPRAAVCALTGTGLVGVVHAAPSYWFLDCGVQPPFDSIARLSGQFVYWSSIVFALRALASDDKRVKPAKSGQSARSPMRSKVDINYIADTSELSEAKESTEPPPRTSKRLGTSDCSFNRKRWQKSRHSGEN